MHRTRVPRALARRRQDEVGDRHSERPPASLHCVLRHLVLHGLDRGQILPDEARREPAFVDAHRPEAREFPQTLPKVDLIGTESRPEEVHLGEAERLGDAVPGPRVGPKVGVGLDQSLVDGGKGEAISPSM